MTAPLPKDSKTAAPAPSLRPVRMKAAALLLVVLAFFTLFADEREKILAHRLFDAYQTMMPRERASAPVIIVAIDEESLKAYGQWPWSRTVMARLLDNINAHEPAAVGIDIIFAEPDRFDPERIPDALPDLTPSLRRALKDLPSPDARLAAALRKGPFVLGMAGLEEGDNLVPAGIPPLRAKGGDPAVHLRNYRGLLRSIELLDNAAPGRGLLSVDIEEGIARRLPLLASVGGQPVPALGLAMLHMAGGAPALDIKMDPQAIKGIGIGDLFIPTTADGRIWIRFGHRDDTRFVSAADVLAGRIAAETFTRKLVLIGFTGIGLLDFVATPVGERMPGIEVHAQFLENIFDSSWLSRPEAFRWGELALMGGLGLVLVLLTPALRPGQSALVWAVMIIASLAAGIFMFKLGFLADMLTPVLGATATYGAALAMTLVNTERRRRELQRDLAAHREAMAHLEGEMEAAKQVQMGMLPAASSLPADSRYELAVIMEPARQVGGDLYDFFHLADDHLFFLVGDVSGKGLPASLFMALSKSLCKSITLRPAETPLSPAEILTQANLEIARDNPESLFVTALAGKIELNTGNIFWATAGHDEPYRVSAADAGVAQLESESGVPLCVVEDFPYKTASAKLAPGDVIVIFTDGVTEAQDRDGDFYGNERLTGCLSRLSRNVAAQDVIDAIRNDVKAFEGGAEQADDMTILALRWLGAHS